MRNIILGWWFWITNYNNDIAKTRLKICVNCPIRKGMICSHCGCILQAKTRIYEESCPIEKW